MKVLMISSDRSILALGSAVSERIKEYGTLVDELHIVLLSDRVHGLKDTQLDKNVWVYPTNSLVNLLRPVDAARLGRKIIFDKKFVRGQSIITTQDPFECGWAGMKIKKKWRIPLEVQLHTNPFSSYFKGFQNIVRKLFVRRILRNADSLRVVSSNLKSQISGFSSANIKVLPIYVDRKKIEDSHVTFDLHARYPWRFIMLSVSRLAPEKNLEFMIEVLARVREKFSNIGLVIVGSGPEENKLKMLVKKLELEGAVEFVGWQNDLSSYYKTANAFIQTSLFEGYGLALVEAGLSSLPIITTPVGIALELIADEDAYIYPAGNADLFVSGILNLIEDNYKREILRTNLKHKLESIVLSKDDYMAQIKDNWENTAKRITS